MSKSIMGLLVVGIAILVIPLIACSDDPAPALSLDEYLLQCSVFADQEDLEEGSTYGELSAALGEVIEMMSSLMPPEEVADWHNKTLELGRTLKGVVDSQPKEKVIGIEFFGIAAELEGLQEGVTEAENALPAEIRRRMVEAGCLEDAEDAPEAAADDHGDDFDNATSVAVGEEIAIALEHSDDRDVLVFNAESGAGYEITLDRHLTTGSSEPTGPIMALYDAGGQELARLEKYSYREHTIVWQDAAAGDHYIVMGDGAKIGSFTVILNAPEHLQKDDHGNCNDNATAIVVGEPVPGTVEYPQDLDFFSFSAVAGQPYHISVSLGTLEELRLKLFDSAGERVNSNPRYPLNQSVWTAPISGAYYLEVTGNASRTGTYTLMVTEPLDDHGGSIEKATTAAIGEQITGMLNYKEDLDFFTFTAQAGQAYRIELAPGTLEETPDFRLSYSTDSEPETGWRSWNGDTVTITLDEWTPGAYYLEVNSFRRETGTYTLTISLEP